MSLSRIKFADAFRVKHGYAFKGQYFDTSGPFVLLTPGSFNETGGIRHQGEKTKFYTGDVPEGYVMDEGELLIAMTEQAPGLLGSSLLVPEAGRFLHNQRLGRIVDLNAKLLDRRFLYNLFNTRSVRHQISGSASGTKVRHTAPERIGRVEVDVPPVAEQHRIASIITAYDDLIENNRRRMVLLEESARLLYREWFVRLRFPGHESSRIVNGVPEGWECVPLEKVAEFRLGKMLDQVKNKGDEMPYLANINVRWGEVDLSGLREMRFTENELEVFGLKFGDIIMCEGGEPGRCAIWKDQLPGMMFQKAIHRIRCRENMEYVYLYQNLRYQAQAGHLASLFTGATIKHFPREKLAKVTVVLPPKPLLDLFSEHVVPIARNSWEYWKLQTGRPQKRATCCCRS